MPNSECRLPGPAADCEALKDAVRRARQKIIVQALEQSDGDVAEAAAVLGILRTSLYRIMKRYGIPPPTRAGE